LRGSDRSSGTHRKLANRDARTELTVGIRRQQRHDPEAVNGGVRRERAGRYLQRHARHMKRHACSAVSADGVRLQAARGGRGGEDGDNGQRE